MNKLGEFIAAQLHDRDMSARQFADLVKVNHSTITKAMYKEPPIPSMEFLLKLSKATNTSLITIISLAFPNENLDVDLDARTLAERIMQLPPEKREIAEAFIIGTLAQGNKK